LQRAVLRNPRPPLPLLLALLLASSAAASASAIPEGVVAIGDVHGDADTFLRLLRSLEIIDAKDRWSGGRRRLVLTGDLIDRGAASRQVLEIVMRLEAEAKTAGGEVIALLGNHEVMNLTADLSSRSAAEFVAFREDEDAAARAQRRESILQLVRGSSPLLASRYYAGLARVLDARSFDRFFPPGYFALLSAHSAPGRYGAWLRSRPIVHREGNTLFLHGGLSARYGGIPYAEMNRLAREALSEHDAVLDGLERLRVFDRALGAAELRWLVAAERAAGNSQPDLQQLFGRLEALWRGVLFDEDGPLWYRGLALGNERALGRALEATLAAQGVDRLVLGHTQPRGLAVESRFHDRVILIDTGLNQAVYGGTPSAVILRDDGTIAVWER